MNDVGIAPRIFLVGPPDVYVCTVCPSTVFGSIYSPPSLEVFSEAYSCLSLFSMPPHSAQAHTLVYVRAVADLVTILQISVHYAGEVDRWMAVRTDTGKPADNVGVLVATAGVNDHKALQASFAKARNIGFEENSELTDHAVWSAPGRWLGTISFV